MINPLRHFIDRIIFCLPGDGVAKNNTSDRLSSKESDIKLLHRSYPVRNSVVVNLKTQLSKDVGRIPEPQMPVNVPVEIFACGVFHSFVQHDKLCRLSRHIDPDICRNTFGLIRKPFNHIGIAKRGYPHRLILVIDLTVELIHLKLGYHIHHASHLPVSKQGRRIPVEKRDLIKRKLLDVRLKIAILYIKKLLVLLGIDNRGGQQRPCQIYRYYQKK